MCINRKQASPNTKQVAEALIALSVDSRDAVDALVDKAVAVGGSPSNEISNMGFMYSRSFPDPDDHYWEGFYMDPSYVQ